MAVTAVVAVPGLVVWAAASQSTFGFDFLAYHQAANRVLHGERLYDPSVQQTGGFGVFYYPPPFLFPILPLAILPPDVASWTWLAVSVVALFAGVAILPVSPTTRWVVLLLVGLSWPAAYALKLGQVGPILFLLFVAGWRAIDRPVPFGVIGALGAIVKIQPGLVLAWAAVTRRWSAAVVGAVVVAVAIVAATLLLGGTGIWADYVALLRNVSDPIRTPHNFTPGAVAFRLGVDPALAAGIEIASSLGVVALALWSALRQSSTASYLIAVVASQLLSPVLWDHYAMLLLVPIAWLLDRGRRWGLVPALATSVFVLPFGLPDVVVPIVFWAVILGLAVEGRSARAGLRGTLRGDERLGEHDVRGRPRPA